MENYENLRTYAWNYFQYHAGQRLTAFNFYIVISTLMISGFFLAVQSIPALALILGIVIVFLSFVFWKLDIRNKQLIKNSENALKYIESKDPIPDKAQEIHLLNIFKYEEAQTEALRQEKHRTPWKSVFTYSTCLNSVFITFTLLGLIGIIYSIVVIL